MNWNLNPKQIARAIAQAETRTSGEIICIIAGKSGTYPHTPYVVGLLATLAATLAYLASHGSAWQAAHGAEGTQTLYTLFVLQLLTFCVTLPLVSLTPLRFILTPKKFKHATAHQLAQQQFLARGLHLTPSRTGVLIFVSVAERYAEIIADESIHRKVKPDTWQKPLAHLLTQIRGGNATQGFITTVEDCAEILAEHFPHQKGTRNQVPNLIIQLP